MVTRLAAARHRDGRTARLENHRRQICPRRKTVTWRAGIAIFASPLADGRTISTSEAPPVFVMRGECRLRVLAPHAGLVQCRDGWISQRFTASREAAASRAYVTRFWESPGYGMCFRARRRLSRRERMAGECARVLSGPLVPSLIRSHPAEARITAKIAENAIHRGRPQFPVGRWTDRINWVVDDWCSAPMPASGRLRQRRALQDPRGLTVDDEPLNHPAVD